MSTPGGSAASGGAGLLSDILNYFGTASTQKWDRGALVNVLNQLDAGNQYGLQRQLDVSNPLRDQTLGQLARGNQQLYGNDGSPGLYQQLQDLISKGTSGLDKISTGNLHPATQAGIDKMQGSIDNYTPIIQQIQAQLANGGVSPDSGALRGMMSQMMNAQGQHIGVQGDVGDELLGNRGNTQYTGGVQGLAGNVLNAGGATDLTNYITKLSQGMVNANGNDAVTKALTSAGLNKFNQPSLIGTDQAVSIARDQAATQGNRNAQNAYRIALARGGGPGSIVGGGSQNEALKDFFDSNMQQQANATQNALVNQQGLGLTNNAQGLSATATGEGDATTRLLQSMGLLPQSQSLQTQNVQAYGGLGNQAASQQDRNLNTGAGLLQNVLGTQFQGAQGLQNANSADLQRLLGLVGASNSATQGQITGQGDILSAIAQGLGLNLSQGKAYNEALTNLLSGTQSQANSVIGQVGDANKNLGNLSGQFGSYAQTALGGLPHVFSGAMQGANVVPASAFGSLGSQTGSMATGLGGLGGVPIQQMAMAGAG